MKLKSLRANAAVILTALILAIAAATTAPAQTFTNLHNFDGTDGANPSSGLVQATNGSLYGTTGSGGDNTSGTVYKITKGGTLTTLYSFCSQSCTDGGGPNAGLIQGTDGNFYGTTEYGGASGSNGGTVFQITPSGTLRTLYSFCAQSGCTDGEYPTGLVGTDGNLYGTTEYGGASGSGTVYKITKGGTLTTLYSFCSQSNCTDGLLPYAQLVQATDGDFYGTTTEGGINSGYGISGTVFKITPSGTLTTLYSFCPRSNCTDGASPYAGLVQATDGNFYGTTLSGAFGYGTVFKISQSGTLTTLYSFCSQSGCTDGEYPTGLVQGTDRNFYGTTSRGGANTAECNGDGCGTVFKITPSGTLTTLYSFCPQSGCRAGANPDAGVVQATDGNFYGTTFEGGRANGGYGGYGTIFTLSMGLGPFVETQTTSGTVGATVRILGTDLTGATSVSFNGTAATFAVVSSSFIKATVPAGATNGFVTVTTPSGTLRSNKKFLIRP